MHRLSRAGSGLERIVLLHFLAGRHTRRLNQALSVLSLSTGFWVFYCCLLGPLFVLTLVYICMCSVTWLLVVKLSVLASDWLERLLRWSLLMVRRLSPRSPGRRALVTFRYYAPPLIGGDIKRCFCLTSDVSLTPGVCLSRTSGLTWKQRGLGRPKLAQR